MQLLLSIIFSFFSWFPWSLPNQPLINCKQDTVIHSGLFIAGEDAERILGQAVRMSERSYTGSDSVNTSRCTYTTVSADPVTNQTGHLYWLAEQYRSPEAAHQVYAEILNNNDGMAGIDKLSDLGEEGWVQTDKTNFHFILFRKKNMVVRMKVNKITSFTSLDQLKKIAAGVAASI